MNKTLRDANNIYSNGNGITPNGDTSLVGNISSANSKSEADIKKYKIRLHSGGGFE